MLRVGGSLRGGRMLGLRFARCARAPILAALGLAAALAWLTREASGQATPLDLNALILEQCGPPGYRPDSGCKVELGAGTFALTETLRLGGCTTATVRNSVTLEGRSAGLVATSPRFATGGTTLEWQGPQGGIVIDACGASFLSLRDLTLDAENAAVGIRISADNSKSALSHFVELRNLVIDGPEFGVYVTGRNRGDQADFVVLDRVSLSNVTIGYYQDSGQAVAGRLETVEVTARAKGFEIRNGSLTCDGCYVGSLAPGITGGMSFIAFHLRSGGNPAKRWEAHHQVHIEHSHMELKRGRFIVEDAGADYPITLTSNSYSLQCAEPDCEMLVVDSQSEAPLVMIGDVIQAASSPPAHPRARVCHRGELVQLGVHKKAEVAALEWSCAP